MKYSVAYFNERGVTFAVSAEKPIVHGPVGPLADALLRQQLLEAIQERIPLERGVGHAGPCDKSLVTTEDGVVRTSCRKCRFARGRCVMCGDTGLPVGHLDCALCRLAASKRARKE